MRTSFVARLRREPRLLFAPVRRIRLGALFRKTISLSIADALRDHGAYLISDEIYRELYYTPERPESLSSFYDRTIVISGLSKSMSMTGWRLGWLCGEEAVVQAALVLHGYVTTCASTVSQKARWLRGPMKLKQRAPDFARRFARAAIICWRLIDSELGLRAVTPRALFTRCWMSVIMVRRWKLRMRCWKRE